MKVPEIFAHLQGLGLPGLVGVEEHPKDDCILVEPGHARAVLRACKEDPALDFHQLMCVTGVHYPGDRFDVVYHLLSMSQRHRIAIKAHLPHDEPSIETVSDLWPAADWHERETWDLMGITFRNHPDPRRILLPDDWEGHPLRKDYVYPKEYRGIRCD